MVNINLPYVERTTAKGRVYWYFRRGPVRLRLPEPDSPEFAIRYAELMNEPSRRMAPGYGTMAWLVQSYRQSPAFKELGDRSRNDREAYLNTILDRWGKDAAARLSRGKVIEIRDSLQATPGAANKTISALSVLMERAIDLDLRATNPCRRVKRLALGEYRRWPENVLQAAMDAASPMMRLAIASLYYGGQRVSDTVRMSRSHILGGDAQLVQQKTGKTVSVPLHDAWRAEIEKVPASVNCTTLLYNSASRPLRENALQKRWRLLRDEIGADGYNLHGLRKNACCKLAEVGATPFEIAAITGQSLKMVEYYVREADKPTLASRAIGRWQEHDQNKSAKLSGKTAKPGNDR